MPDRNDLAYKSEIDLLVSACIAAGVRPAVDNPSDLGRMLWQANIACADRRHVLKENPDIMEDHRNDARNYVFTLSDTAYYDRVLAEIDDYERLLPVSTITNRRPPGTPSVKRVGSSSRKRQNWTVGVNSRS